MHSLENDGFSIPDVAIGSALCDRLARTFRSAKAGHGGIRNLLEHPAVTELMRSDALATLARALVGAEACAVKATLFDKRDDANWKVPWHQDRVIAVAARVEANGFSHWSNKDGVLHVEPPRTVLESMVAIRIHIDACPADRGPLRVLPGTHRLGVLTPSDLDRVIDEVPPLVLTVPRGAIIVMRPLLIHASSSTRTPDPRRVLHIELAPRSAPAPLDWAAPIPLRIR